jgi:YVTN family beta-propeller protein
MDDSLINRLIARRELYARLAAMLAVQAIIVILVFAFRPQAQAAPSKPAGPVNTPADYPETTGGPDNFGYTFLDSTEPGGPTYAWEEISGTGTLATGWNSYDDGYAGPFPVGFNFNFYGNEYSELYIGVNGFLSFAQGWGSIPYGTLPSVDEPNNDIALFGGDMYLYDYGNDSAVYYQTLANPSRFVVQFVNLHYCCSQNIPHTFQVILYPNGDIQAQYHTLSSDSTSYVGIENSSGSVGLGYNNTLADNLAIRYEYPSGVYLEPAAQARVADLGATATYTVSLKNLTGASDTFALSLQSGNTWTTTLSITQTGTINDGETMLFNVAVDVPLSAAGGDLDTAIIQATSITSPTITTTATLRTIAGGGDLAYVAMAPWDYLAVVEPVSLTYLDRVDLSSVCDRPVSVAVPPNGATIWVACRDNNQIIILDRDTLAIIDSVATSYAPLELTFSQDSQYAFVILQFSSQLLIIDTETYFYNQVSFPNWAVDIVTHPYLPLLYLSESYEDQILVMDTNSLDIVASIELADEPYYLAISPDGARLYVSAAFDSTIAVIDTQTNQVIGEISGFSSYPRLTEVSADGSKLFVPQNFGTLAIADTASLSVEQFVELDPNSNFYDPWDADLTCDGQTLLVTNISNNFDQNGRQVAAVDANTYDVLGLLPMPDTNGDNYPDWGAYGVTICPQHVHNGVILLPQAQTNTGALGEVVAHQATLYNQTGATDSFTVTLGSHVWDAAPADTVVGPINHGDSITVTVYVTVPLNANWYETDTVALTTASVTSPTVYSDTVTVTTEAFAPAEISQTPDGLSAILQVGDATTETLTIQNGNGVTLTFEITETAQVQSLLELTPEDDHLDGVLILYDRTHNQSSIEDTTLLATLEAAGATVEENWAYPVNADVLADADVLWLAISSMHEWAQAEIDAVQEWLDAGGGLFIEGLDWQDHAAPFANAVGVTYLDQNLQDQTTNGIVPHDITTDVNGVFVYSANHQLDLTAPAEPIVTIPNPYPGPPDAYNHVAAAESNGGKVVVLAGRDLNESAISQADNLTLGENIFAWLALPSYVDFPWLRETPSSGFVATNSSQPISVTFDAAAMQPGDYYANLRTNSNDPDDRNVTLPVTLTVLPTASMGWVEGTVSDATSGDPLAATLVALGEPYVVSSNPDTGYYKFWLEPGNYTLEVSAEGYVTDTVLINIVTQQGTTQDIILVPNIPIANPSPDSFTIEQEVGEVTVETLTIENLGPAELTFQLGEQGDNGAARRLGAGVLIIQDNYPWGYDSIQQILNNQNILYDQISSGELAGVDLSAYRLVIVPSDQQSGFYGNWNANMHKVESYVTDGGALWLSFTNNPGFIALPGDVVHNWNPDGYNNVVAPDHPWVAGVSPVIYGSSASHLGFTNLYPGSQIVVQTQGNSTPTLIDYRVGIGRVLLSGMTLEIAWALAWDAAPILSNSLLDLYNWNPDVSWLSLSPESGVVPGYGSQDVDVTLDATGLQPGVYEAQIFVSSNDPANPLLTVPIAMTVSPTANMGQVMGTVTDAWTGEPLNATVELVGVYADTADPTYTIWADAGSYTLNAYTPGYATDTANVNITAGGTQVVNLALEPAQARLEGLPDEVEAMAPEGQSVQQTLIISNTGPLPLDFSLHELNPNRPNQENGMSLEGVQIMYDLSHGESSLSNYIVVYEALLGAGATVTENNTFPITAAALAPYDILWVTCCGFTEWTPAELAAISAWLADGGAILVHGLNSPANDTLAGHFGIDYVDSNCANGTTTQVEPHIITENVETVFLPYGCDRLDSAVAPAVVFNPQGEAQVRVYEQGSGKIVATSDFIFSSGPVDNEDNFVLAMNTFLWLSGMAYVDVPWLSAAPAAGSVPGHDETAVTVTFDAAGLAPGVYEATLAVEHNDPNQPSPLYLPVQFEVIASSPDVALGGDQAGTTAVGTSVVYTFTVTNLGNAADTFALTVNSTWNATLSASSTGPLDPGENFVFTLTVAVPYGVNHGLTRVATITARSGLDQSVTDTAQATTTAVWRQIALPIIVNR